MKTNLRSRVFLYSWNEHSEGARELARELGIKRIRHERSRFKQKPWKTVINWGSGTLQDYSPENDDAPRILNEPRYVRVCQNKLEWFRKQCLAAAPCRIPEWTTNKELAAQWIKDKKEVVCRAVLNGHSGNGIVIAKTVEQLVSAPLYVQYIPKAAEYRVHFVQGERIDVQRKIRDPEREPTDWAVRSHQNGFIFARNNLDVPEDVFVQAEKAFTASGLDFGCVDVIWNNRRKEAYVLEINTAPGITGTTVENYANAFRKMLTGG